MGLKPTWIAGVLFSHDLKVVAIPERRGNTEDPGNVSGIYCHELQLVDNNL
jgi:hypothetical protein